MSKSEWICELWIMGLEERDDNVIQVELPADTPEKDLEEEAICKFKQDREAYNETVADVGLKRYRRADEKRWKKVL